MPPLMPAAALTRPTGLPRSGEVGGGRDAQSIAFFSTPGTL
jgi:hypothetical protein